MKRYFLSLISFERITLLPCLFCFIFHSGFSQQNLFNVPSSDITLQHKIFFQQQFNINKSVYQLNSTFCYGLGHHTEIGVNIIALNINPQFEKPYFLTQNDNTKPPVYPLWTLNIQKAFVLNKIFKLAVGTQTGISAHAHVGTYSYLNLVSMLLRTKSKIITGLYYGNNNFLGTNDRIHLLPNSPIGVQTGIEQTIIHEKLLFVVENITGRHILGETTLGASYYLNDQWVISCGYQMANTGNTSSNALVFELTYVPSAVAHKKIYRHGHVK